MNNTDDTKPTRSRGRHTVAPTSDPSGPIDEPLSINATKTEADSIPEPVKRRILGHDDIIDADDLNKDYVEVPEWGGTVIVRALTGSERDAYEGSIFSSSLGKDASYNLQNLRAKLAARTMVGEDGRRLFTDDEVAVLGLKSAAALDRVFTVAQRLSRLSQADVKELTDQLTKSLSAGSGSDSPAS